MINTQTLLRKQLPKLSALQSTLLQFKAPGKKLLSGMQIVHCPNDHWVTLFKEHPSTNVIKVLDSVFNSVRPMILRKGT